VGIIIPDCAERATYLGVVGQRVLLLIRSKSEQQLQYGRDQSVGGPRFLQQG